MLKDKLGFYNSIYEREVKRSEGLDLGINAPITILTLMVGILYFIYSKIYQACPDTLSIVIFICLGIAFAFIVIALIFLSFSFNNFFKGFKYMDLPKTSELHKYDKEVEGFNPGESKEDKIDFVDYVIQQYVVISDDYAEKNDRRSLHLYRAKTMLVLTFFVELIAILLYVIKSNS